MITRVHVNRINIALNNQDNGKRPVFTVTQGDTVTHAHEVRLLGPSRMLYDAEQETSDGARAWIETESPVELVGG